MNNILQEEKRKLVLHMQVKVIKKKLCHCWMVEWRQSFFFYLLSNNTNDPYGDSHLFMEP